jgi:general secretion pathway protein G
MSRRQNRRRRQGGFTLIEVLLVLVILVALGSMVGVFIRRAQQQADIDIAKSQMGLFKTPLEQFAMSVKRFPTSEEGLEALRIAPQDAPLWNGPYLENDVPLDPWGNEYIYELIDSETYQLSSAGPNGVPGDDDDVLN